MITTVCMNPSFDKTASVERMIPGEVNRLKNVRVDLGGKGINVAITLKRLGVPVHCIGCIGDVNQSAFLRMVEEEGLTLDHLTVEGKTRTNLKLLDEQSHTITEFNEPGLEMQPDALERFQALLESSARQSEFVVFSGRLPAGCPENTYQRLMSTLPGKKIVLDTAGEALLHGIKEQPFLIKPNLPEMEAIMKKELRTLRALRDAALFLQTYGAQNVVISMGKYGAVLVSQDGTWFAPALQVEAHSTVGAGDAMLGGMLFGLNNGAGMLEAFRCGVAAGAASVMTDGTQPLNKTDFEKLLHKVAVQAV